MPDTGVQPDINGMVFGGILLFLGRILLFMIIFLIHILCLHIMNPVQKIWKWMSIWNWNGQMSVIQD